MSPEIQQKIHILENHIPIAQDYMKSCCVCPRNCNVNRTKDDKGFCGIGKEAYIAKTKIKKEREPILNGPGASGMVFFTSCNMRCIYCNQYRISQTHEGTAYTPETMAELFLRLQSSGAQNINLISPTHVSPQIMHALLIAYQNGLNIPLIYNTGGFDSLKMLRLLDGIVDVYIISLKYGDKKIAKLFSLAINYPRISFRALNEINQQQKQSIISPDHLIHTGVIVRHLVLPNNICQSELIFQEIKHINTQLIVSIFLDYQPDYRATQNPSLKRRLNYQEINKIRFMAQLYGLKNVTFYD